jgi:hypothetical protein
MSFSSGGGVRDGDLIGQNDAMELCLAVATAIIDLRCSGIERSAELDHSS